jgi:hypothetical protein
MELDQFLQEAEFEEIGTQIKLAFAWVAGTVELLVPGLSLLMKGGTALMEVMLAESMGKEEEVAIKGVKLGLESIKDIKRAGPQLSVTPQAPVRKRTLAELEYLQKIGQRSALAQRAGEVASAASRSRQSPQFWTWR